MKKNISKLSALYPSLIVIVGAFVNDKPSYTLVGHVGNITHTHLIISLLNSYYINQGIIKNKILSVNIVDEELLKRADKTGLISGNKEDKSNMFDFKVGENGAPLINDSKISIECKVDDIYKLDNFDIFICKILATYVEESITNENNKIDYHIFKPIFFEFPTYEYFKLGDKVGDCLKMNK